MAIRGLIKEESSGADRNIKQFKEKLIRSRQKLKCLKGKERINKF